MGFNWKRCHLLGFFGLNLGIALGLTGCQGGKCFLCKNTDPVTPPPMWQVKPSDSAGSTANGKKMNVGEGMAQADDRTNAFTPPGAITRTAAATVSASTGFQTAGGRRPISPPPTAQGSPLSTAGQLPLPKLPEGAPVPGTSLNPNSIQPLAGMDEVQSPIEVPGKKGYATRPSAIPEPIVPDGASPVTTRDLLPPPPPEAMASPPTPGALPVPAVAEMPPAFSPVSPPTPVVNPNPPPNVTGPAVMSLPIGGGSTLPPPPGSPTIQGSPLSIPAPPSATPAR